jgi:hypothetical protein
MNMKRFITVAILALAAPAALVADPISLTLVPSAQTVGLGSHPSEVVMVSGVGHPPSIGTYDLSLTFSSSILAAGDVAFSSFLGVPGVEALTDFTMAPGTVEFAEVSLLPSTSLDALQTASFPLATITFTATGLGTTALSFSMVTVDDAFGGKLTVSPGNGSITVVPEPSTGLTLLLVMGTVLALRMAWGKTPSSEKSKKI